MRKRLCFSTLILFSVFSVGFASALAVDPAWFDKLGDNPGETVFHDSMRRLLTSNVNAVNDVNLPLPDPTLDPNQQTTNIAWETWADRLSAFVNIYRLSGDPQYLNLAQRIADWFIVWNDYLVSRADSRYPYLGWGKDPRRGFYNDTCATAFGFNVVNSRGDYDANHADEAWDTAHTARALIKYSETTGSPISSSYFLRAQRILDSWPFREHATDDGNPATPGWTNDGPYAAAGLRFYMKSNDPCEIRYVKNTGLVMAEQFFRAYKITGDPRYLGAGAKGLYAQLWDNVSHLNFGYNSYMIRIDTSDGVYSKMLADDDNPTPTKAKVEHRDDGSIVCRGTDITGNVDCWNHLGFEGYDLYVIQQVISDLPPEGFLPSTSADLATAIGQTMFYWRQSVFGDPNNYPWDSPPSGASPTHVTAYNCALRFSADPTRRADCVTALSHNPSGATIFYSLVPDAIFTQGLGSGS